MLKKTFKSKNQRGFSVIWACDECEKLKRMSKMHADRSKTHFCNKECYRKYLSKNKDEELHIKKSIAKMGKKNPMFGKKYSPEQKKNIALKNFANLKKTKTNLGKVADGLWARIIKSKGKCEVCGAIGQLNPHHIIGRKNYTTRYDLKNGICLCVSCHVFGKLSAHQDPLWFSEWMRKNKPEIVEHLKTKRQEITKWSVSKYLELIEHLRTFIIYQ